VPYSLTFFSISCAFLECSPCGSSWNAENFNEKQIKRKTKNIFLISVLKINRRDNVTRFFVSVFFSKQLLLVPIGLPRNDFKLFLLSVEIFNISGALPEFYN
jgi:hypothetical protein